MAYVRRSDKARGGVFGGHEMNKDKDKAFRRHVLGKHVLVADTMINEAEHEFYVILYSFSVIYLIPHTREEFLFQAPLTCPICSVSPSYL